MTQEEKTMLTYARDVFQGTQQVEDISYTYRQQIASFLNTLGLEQEPPQELDEAAGDYASYYFDCDNKQEMKAVVDTFKAGAKWMADSGIVTEAFIRTDGMGVPMIHFYDDKVKELIGDKVIVQIRKAE